MSWKPEQEETASALIPLKGTPLGDDSPKMKLRRSFAQTMHAIWGAIRGNTASDIARMREGGVKKVEGIGQMAIAEADAKVAEAANSHADAELKRAQAKAVLITSEAEAIKAKASALRELAEAVTLLRQDGGDVAFDFAELQRTVLGTSARETSVVKAEMAPNQNVQGSFNHIKVDQIDLRDL